MRSSYVVQEHSGAPPEVVFRLLADAPGWQHWAGPIVPRSGWEPGAPQGGVGAVRRLGTGPLSSREEIVELEPPRRLGYVLRSGESLHHYRATVDLTPADGGGTRILWSGTVESRVPGVAPALRAVFHALVRGFARRLARAAETAAPAE
jgi:uncharacterized protein YndB with AHSA1/START domain